MNIPEKNIYSLNESYVFENISASVLWEMHKGKLAHSNNLTQQPSLTSPPPRAVVERCLLKIHNPHHDYLAICTNGVQVNQNDEM